MRILVAMACCAALSGCFNIQQQGSNNVSITGQAIGGGTDDKAVKCSGTATLTVKYSGSAGTLEVALLMGSSSVYDTTFQPTATEQTATQTFGAGDYDLVVTRSSDWKGSYDVKVSCP
jgi:hypothetical protein